MKNLITLFLTSILLLGFYGCKCEDLTELDPEDVPFSDFRLIEDFTNFDGPVLFMEFMFNDSLDGNSVVRGENLIITGEANDSITVFFSAQSIRVMVESDCTSQPCDKTVSVEISGDEPNPILNIGGEVLDGDNNLLAGGKFEETYFY